MPWSGRVRAAVAAYTRELTASEPALRARALRREMRDGRSDPLLRRLIRSKAPLSLRDVTRLVGFYERALWDHYEGQWRRFLKAEARETRLWSAWRRVTEASRIDPRLIVKVWQTRLDNRVRPSHQAMESVAIPLPQLFVVDGMAIAHPPGDWGCRCYLRYVVLDAVPTIRDDGSVVLPAWALDRAA